MVAALWEALIQNETGRRMARMFAALLAGLLPMSAGGETMHERYEHKVSTYDKGWSVCKPFVNKADRELRVPVADVLEIMSRIPEPKKKKRLSKERAAYLVFRKRNEEYSVTQPGRLVDSSWESIKRVIDEYYSGDSSISAFTMDLNDGAPSHVMEIHEKDSWDITGYSVLVDAEGKRIPGLITMGALRVFNGAAYLYYLMLESWASDGSISTAGNLQIYRPNGPKSLGSSGYDESSELCKFAVLRPRTLDVCKPFMKKVDRKGNLLSTDILKIMSRMPAPEKKRLSKERAAYLAFRRTTAEERAAKYNGSLSEGNWKALKRIVNGYYSGDSNSSMFVIDIMNDGVPRHVLEYRWNGVGERDIFARNIVTDAAGNPDHEFAERARFKEISGEIRIFNGATHVFNPLESEIAKRNYLMIYRPGDLGYPRSSLGELCRFYVVHPGTKRAKP